MRNVLTGAALGLALVACDDRIGVTNESEDYEGVDQGVTDTGVIEPLQCCHGWVREICAPLETVATPSGSVHNDNLHEKGGLCGEVGQALLDDCLVNDAETIGQTYQEYCVDQLPADDFWRNLCAESEEGFPERYCGIFAAHLGAALHLVDRCQQEASPEGICAEVTGQCVGICEQIARGDFGQPEPSPYYDDYCGEN